MFRNDHLLWLLWLLPLYMAGRYVLWRRRQKRLNAFIASGHWKTLIPTLKQSRQVAKAVLLGASLFFIIIAILRPQGAAIETIDERKGYTVMMVLDVSHSMSAKDVLPSRLEVAKREIRHLLGRLGGDQVGLVIFSGNAFLQCPLTFDHDAFELFLDDVSVGSVPRPGTNLAAAIRKARETLGYSRTSKGIIVVFTDGEVFEGEAKGSTEIAAEMGIRIFTVGVGTPSGEPIPIHDDNGSLIGFKKDKNDQVILSSLHDAELRDIAEKTGAKYYNAEGRVLVSDDVYRDLSNLETSSFDARNRLDREEQYRWPLFLALLCLIIEWIFPLSWREKDA